MKKSKQKSKGTARPPKHQQYGKHLSTYSKDSMTEWLLALVSRFRKQEIKAQAEAEARSKADEGKSPTAYQKPSTWKPSTWFCPIL